MKLEGRRRKNNDRLKKLSQKTHGNKYFLLKKKERFEYIRYDVCVQFDFSQTLLLDVQ